MKPALIPCYTHLRSALLGAGAALLLACGGGGGGYSGDAGGNSGVPPAFQSQPAAATVTEGQSASFTASANGTPAPSEQWERSSDGTTWNAIPGATSSTYTFTAGKPDNSMQYRARASNSYGSATSNAAPLTVYWAPVLTAQPVNQSVSSPSPATFSISMDGNPAVACQWQRSTDGTTWQDIPGATSPTYVTGPTTGDMNNWLFRCVCTNSVGTSVSAPATLILNVPSFALTVNLGAGTSGTPAAGGSFADGTVVPYAYAASAGYSNLQVLLDGNVVPASGSLTMNGAHAFAVSASPVQRSVTFGAGAGGTVTGALTQSVADGGSTSAVTAVPDSGFTFLNWTGAGFTPSTANPLVVSNVLQDLALTANFQPVATTYKISATAGIYGNISPSGTVTVQPGASITFTITADLYYVIANVMVDGVSVGAVSSYTFDNVTANHTISATFTY
jgi:hypothetical protein